MRAHALAWAARGFRVFPISVGQKFPPPLGWQEMATSDPERIAQLWGDEPYNIGVLAEGIIVDIDDKNGKTGSFDWDLLGYPDNTLTVRTPTGGRHLYYATDEATAQPNLTDSINTRAGGLGYALAPGSVTEDGEYTLLEDLPVLPAPKALVEHCQKREGVDWDGSVELDTDEAVGLAEAFLKDRAPAVEGKGGDLWTYKTACGVIDFGISADLAADLMLGWNETCSPPWSPEALQAKCNSAWRNRRNKAGVKSPEIEFGGIVIPEVPVAKRSGLLWAGDKTIQINQQWLMWNRLPRTGVGLLIGRSGCGKTFLSLDLAAHLAQGDEWFREVGDEKVGTVVLAAEGIGGLSLRIKHLRDKLVPVAATTMRSLRDDDERKAVQASIEEARDQMDKEFGVRLGLIIIDTLTASNLFENENDANDVGRGLRALNNLAESSGCFVLAVHHPPKTGSGARGSYALHAGVDVVIEVFDQGKGHVVECTKGRDAETGWWGSYTMRKEAVEPDVMRGRDLTTMRVHHGEEKREARDPEPPIEAQETVRQSFFDVRAEMGLGKDDPVPVDEMDLRLRKVASKGKGKNYKSLTACLQWFILKNYVRISYDTAGRAELCEVERSVYHV